MSVARRSSRCCGGGGGLFGSRHLGACASLAAWPQWGGRSIHEISTGMARGGNLQARERLKATWRWMAMEEAVGGQDDAGALSGLEQQCMARRRVAGVRAMV